MAILSFPNFHEFGHTPGILFHASVFAGIPLLLKGLNEISELDISIGGVF